MVNRSDGLNFEGRLSALICIHGWCRSGRTAPAGEHLIKEKTSFLGLTVLPGHYIGVGFEPGAALRVVVMYLLLLLPLALPFACLALLSFVAFLGIAAIGGALRVISVVTSALGIAGQKGDDPWRRAVGDAHPLDCVEVPR
jgi:hypothetical protein